ncbi:hypothetical protein QUA81_14985 [Microcoleus sp. F6_B4]
MKITRLFLLYIAGIRAGFGDRVSDFFAALDNQASRIPATRFIRPEIKNLYPMTLAERIYLAQVKASI